MQTGKPRPEIPGLHATLQGQKAPQYGTTSGLGAIFPSECRSARSSGRTALPFSPWMNRNRIMILSRILSSSSSVASLLPARNFESTCLAGRARVPVRKGLWGQSREDSWTHRLWEPSPTQQPRKTQENPQICTFQFSRKQTDF